MFFYIKFLMFFLTFSCSMAYGVLANSPTHNFVIILSDASGSMKQSDPRFLRREAINLLITLLRDGDKVALAEFGDGYRELTNGTVTLNSKTRQELMEATEKFSAKDQHTDILSAFQYALNQVTALPLEVRKSYAPTVILLTDGKDDFPGLRDRSGQILEKVKELAQLGVVVHAVGFSHGADLDRVLLRKVADATGGDLCIVEKDRDLLGGFFGLSRILGNRWAINEKVVAGGAVKLTIPPWAGKIVACYLPQNRTMEQLITQAPATRYSDEIIVRSLFWKRLLKEMLTSKFRKLVEASY